MSKIMTTPLVVAIHREKDSPVFGESTTHVCIADEAGGPFIVLKQFRSGAEGEQEMRFDLDELEAIVKAALSLMKAQPK